MQRVGFPTSPPERPRPRRAVMLIALLGGALVAGFLYFVAPSERPSEPEPEDVVLPETTAIRAVTRLLGAIDRGDSVEAVDALAPAWVGLQLPGATRDFLLPSDDSQRIDDAITFTGATVDLSPGDCAAAPGTGPTEFLVECSLEVGGALPIALGHAPTTTVRAGTAGGEVLSLFHDGQTPNALDYCVWASAQYPELAETAFGPSCEAVARAEEVPAHSAMAAGYVAAGVPEPPPDTRDSIEVARVLTGFEQLHEDGADGGRVASALFSYDGPIVRFPGLLPLPLEARDPYPSIADFLTWSGRSYDVDLGRCTIEQRYDDGAVRASCPDATWDGPLVAGLGLNPVTQPIEFIIDQGRITQTLGLTDVRLAASAARFCRTVQKELPQFTAQAFRDDCTPNYSVSGADALLALLEEYQNLIPA